MRVHRIIFIPILQHYRHQKSGRSHTHRKHSHAHLPPPGTTQHQSLTNTPVRHTHIYTHSLLNTVQYTAWLTSTIPSISYSRPTPTTPSFYSSICIHISAGFNSVIISVIINNASLARLALFNPHTTHYKDFFIY